MRIGRGGRPDSKVEFEAAALGDKLESIPWEYGCAGGSNQFHGLGRPADSETHSCRRQSASPLANVGAPNPPKKLRCRRIKIL
jgi:hypothetical protein